MQVFGPVSLFFISKPTGKAIVEFDYEKEQSDELTLCTGDVVNILESDVNEGWSRGELNGKTGLFPDNFVKLLPPEQPKKVRDKFITCLFSYWQVASE